MECGSETELWRMLSEVCYFVDVLFDIFHAHFVYFSFEMLARPTIRSCLRCDFASDIRLQP